MQKTYLVTGAAGFIGGALAQKLIADGNRVVTIDNLSTGKISQIPHGVIFLHGDCQDQKIIDKLNQFSFEAIFHIAGQSSGEISFDNPVYDLQTNGQSTLQLLQYGRTSGCNKFIYASTMSVYGDIPESQLPAKEDRIPFPKSFYGVGKLASEHYLRIYSEQFGIGTAALRLFNVYGPGQNLDNMRQGMVSIFLAQAIKDREIHVKGSADRFRDFIYIDDVVNAFVEAENKITAGNFLLSNVCSGVKTKVSDVVDAIIKQSGNSIPVRYEGITPGDQFGIYGDTDFAKKHILSQRIVSFEEGIERFFEAVTDPDQ